ncbi:WecB/TagA/CpsF family glycosyltransferase [Cognataquiflexum rubidum]|uniref:WecB/TagA/CpsF family glycosyltransferase n=1 Tax=Cognataquiflexum rubidum TaxID=2922273 RepID=UPI001F13326E|nr:WecB/TagA/CpsF family glycosyltransferase [Cognataquiflexum rubidum]MCH6234029.1 WecB/TagA/CpsF family glycosyltransferase [Cognataquiflexum rubidum]
MKSKKSKTITIIGLDFFNGKVEEVLESLDNGGLFVFPSGPGLATINSDKKYHQSLKAADLIVADSGYMALLWNLTHKVKINRVSGLEFITAFVSDPEIQKNSNILLVNPSQKEADANLRYLQQCGFRLSESNLYLAPFYDKNRIEDEDLLKQIEEKKPKYIVINLGGGVQEILGAYLKENLSYRPAIICTGAAIAFLTGHQANIPTWADKLFLGWLIRCIEKPKLYIPRYLAAFKLVALMYKYELGSVFKRKEARL